MKKTSDRLKNYAKIRHNFGPDFLVNTLESFQLAAVGIWQIFKEEPNFRIELVIAAVVLITGILLGLPQNEFLIILLCIANVLFAEIINSVIERICDVYTKEHHIGIKYIKDAAAGGVLLISIIAAIVGFIILSPYVFGVIIK